MSSPRTGLTASLSRNLRKGFIRNPIARIFALDLRRILPFLLLVRRKRLPRGSRTSVGNCTRQGPDGLGVKSAFPCTPRRRTRQLAQTDTHIGGHLGFVRLGSLRGTPDFPRLPQTSTKIRGRFWILVTPPNAVEPDSCGVRLRTRMSDFWSFFSSFTAFLTHCEVP